MYGRTRQRHGEKDGRPRIAEFEEKRKIEVNRVYEMYVAIHERKVGIWPSASLHVVQYI
jgi:hypothetical protein